MSSTYFEAMDAIIESDIPVPWKLPLLTWLRYADSETLDAFPSARTVAERCGVSVSVVRRAIQGATDAGILAFRDHPKQLKAAAPNRYLRPKMLREYVKPTPKRVPAREHPTLQRVPPYSPESTPLLSGEHPPYSPESTKLPIDLPSDLPSKPTSASTRSSALDLVWSEYVEHHPRLAKRQPTDGERKVIKAALKSVKVDGMTQAEVLCLVLRWAHQAQDAAFYRGENDQRKKYLGLSVLLRTSKLADKIDAAVEWSEGETRPSRRYLNQ